MIIVERQNKNDHIQIRKYKIETRTNQTNEKVACKRQCRGRSVSGGPKSTHDSTHKRTHGQQLSKGVTVRKAMTNNSEFLC